jgi:Holliday junction resolvase RusA-like endonuclease
MSRNWTDQDLSDLQAKGVRVLDRQRPELARPHDLRRPGKFPAGEALSAPRGEGVEKHSPQPIRQRLGPEARVRGLAAKRPLAPEIILDFDIPPSANKAWRNTEHGKGRVRSDVYKRWIDHCCTILSDARIPRVDGVFSCLIEARRPTGAKGALRDIDNIIKPTLDLLHTTGMTADDRHCMEVTARWVTKHTNGGIIVVIRKWSAA